MDTQTLKEIDFTKQENILTSEKNLTTDSFVNRKRIEGNVNRKTIIIRGQTANTMDVDILDCGITNPDIESDGTAITAEIMQEFRDVIEQSDQNSQKAYNISKTSYENSVSAYNISQSANTIATSANNTSLVAEQIATEAKNKALEVEGKLADRGATVKIGTDTVTEVQFTTNPQTQLNTQNDEIENIKNNTTIIANTSGGFSCGSGATNGSGLQFKGFTLCDADGKVPVARIVDAIYPVGSIYMSTGSTSPAALFGGTWERLKDKFLLGAGDTYSAGAIGGESAHTLTTNEMPSHTHTQNAHGHQVYGGGDRDSYCYGANYGTIGLGGCINDKSLGYTNSSTNGNALIGSATATNQNSGGGAAHNNMPPYLVVNMWKRIS